MKQWEELSLGEQEYISKKLTGWKVLTFFLTGIGLMRSIRRWELVICLAIAVLGAFLGEAGVTLAFIITRCIALINFTEKAYKHDMTYFQNYLYEYAKLTCGSTKEQKKTKLYEDDNEDKTIVYSRESNRKYDKYGFDEEGYNREGYDAYGFDRDGYNREGYNDEGYNKYGFDKKGYNYKGFDKNGFDKEGYDRRGFDKNGYDREGYDEYGEKRNGEKKKTTTKKNRTVLNKKSEK